MAHKLFYLWHPGTKDIFSGYGLAIGHPSPLVGLIMVDRPNPVDPGWLQELTNRFGDYDLTIMTRSGERGLVAQMWVDVDSIQYLKQFPGELSEGITQALQPLLNHPPKPQLMVAWDATLGLWLSGFKLEGGSYGKSP